MSKTEVENNSQNIQQATSRADQEIDLLELLQYLRKGWLLLVCCILVGGGVALGYSVNLPDIYRADILAVPASNDNKSGASITNQFGGLASLAGISLGGGSVDKLTVALETLKSRSFLVGFIAKYQLSTPLLAAIGWDTKNDNWVYDQEKYNPVTKKWQGSEPTKLSAYRVFVNEVLSLSTDTKTGLVSLSISTYSPRYAQEWATLLVSEINDYIRNAEITEAYKSIDFLRLQLEKTPIADMQNVFFQLIEQQVKTVMLAEVREEYVLKVIDPAVVPDQKVSPNRSIILIVGFFSGGLIGCVFALLYGARKK